MRTVRAMLSNVCGGIGCLREPLGYGLKFLLAMCRPQAALAARLLAVEALMRQGHVIVVADEFLRQPVQMPLAQHGHVIVQLAA